MEKNGRYAFYALKTHGFIHITRISVGDGFRICFIFTPILGEMMQFDEHIFQIKMKAVGESHGPMNYRLVVSTYFFKVHPYSRGKIPNLTCAYFSSIGLVQPPTRKVCVE